MSAADTAKGRPGDADRYRVLLDIGRTLAATLGEDDLYEEIYRETARAVEASGFYLALHDQSRDLARVVFYADRAVRPLPKGRRATRPPTQEELEETFAALEAGLAKINFFKARKPESVMRTLRTLISRAGPDLREAKLFGAIAGTRSATGSTGVASTEAGPMKRPGRSGPRGTATAGPHRTTARPLQWGRRRTTRCTRRRPRTR